MVMAVIVVAGALASRPPPVAVIMLLLAIVRPWWCVPALASAWAMARRATPDPDQSESVYLHAVAMELRAGASLRAALSSATDRTPDLALERVERLASAGAPLDLVADALVPGLPQQGRVAATALRTAGQTGGQVAAVFENLAQVSTEDREMRRETRAATAQARISAWIVGGLPAGYLAFQLVTGRLAELVATPVGLAIVVIGGGFLVTGSTVVVFMLRSALS